MFEAFEEEQSPSNTMRLGVAFLWTGDFEAAFAHFDAANQRQPHRTRTFMRWLALRSGAWASSRRPLRIGRRDSKCAYADAAGGVRFWHAEFFSGEGDCSPVELDMHAR